jgi:uncharacterized repeat protein (TIGR01451 family)
MKTLTQNFSANIGRVVLLATGLMFATTTNVMAAGTTSGTPITNIATINYTVDGTPQPPTDTPPSTFVVDTIVNLLLVEDNDTHTFVAAGSLAQATGFTLTNLGNASQTYSLTAAQSSLAVFGEADAFDVTNFAYYIDGDNNGLLDLAFDTLLATGIVPVMAPDAVVNLLVVADIPVSTPDNTASAISLTAVTYESNGITLTLETLVADTVGSVDIVFADPAIVQVLATGTAAQLEGNATAIALDQYHVQTAALTITKASVVYSDPANGTTLPKAIPGATLTYTITVTNTGTGIATGVSIVDIVDEIGSSVAINPTYNNGTTICTGAQVIAVQDGGVAGLVCQTDAVDPLTDFGDFTTNVASAIGLTLGAAGGGSDTAIMSFQVTIL